MKKTILLFFILTTLLFSTGDFISSNGKLSFKYSSKYDKITRLNGDMGTSKSDISTIQVGVYYGGDYYLLSNYIISKEFIPKTNIFRTVAELPFGSVTTKYIPSMVDKQSFYIVNDYKKNGNKVLNFVYTFDMAEKNGVVKYQKNKDYYQYNDDIYIKNLKNLMIGYIIPASNLEEVKLKKVESTSIKYANQILVMSSKVRDSDKESSDIIQIRYKKEPTFLAFESSKKLLVREKKYWNNWIKPLPFPLDKETEKIVLRFLIYLKTSTDEYNSYTNIGLKEIFDLKAAFFTALTFVKYGYLDDAKGILERIFEVENDFSYLVESRLTEIEIQDLYIYLVYMEKSKKSKEYIRNDEEMFRKIRRIINILNEDQKHKNILDKGYEFDIYYYTYNFLYLYRKASGDNSFIFEETKIRNYIAVNFINENGVKKYRLDEKAAYYKWEVPLFYKGVEQEIVVDALYKKSVFRRYPYFSGEKTIDVDRNLNVLDSFYKNDLKRYGDMNLLRLNDDIEENSMKIPNKVYLKRRKKYQVNGVDVYMTSRYLNVIYDRGEK